jgi:hypothetical protein
MKNEKVICQECGHQLTTWGDKHTLNDCGQYHLKRAQEILGFDLSELEKANDELVHYREENYDQMYEIAFLREDLTDAHKVLEVSLDRAKLEPQPQDMRTRLTLEFNEFVTLQKALSLDNKETREE